MKIIMALILMLASLANAEVYKWTDEDGQVHFGDNPEEGVETELVDVYVEKLGTKMSSNHAQKKWLNQAEKDNKKKAHQRKVYERRESAPKRDSYDCDYAKDRLRYYEFKWNKKRTRGYKQSERNYFLDKISFFEAEIEHECNN